MGMFRRLLRLRFFNIFGIFGLIKRQIIRVIIIFFWLFCSGLLLHIYVKGWSSFLTTKAFYRPGDVVKYFLTYMQWWWKNRLTLPSSLGLKLLFILFAPICTYNLVKYIRYIVKRFVDLKLMSAAYNRKILTKKQRAQREKQAIEMQKKRKLQQQKDSQQKKVVARKPEVTQKQEKINDVTKENYNK